MIMLLYKCMGENMVTFLSKKTLNNISSNAEEKFSNAFNSSVGNK